MELFAIMAIMFYGVVLSYALPPKRHFMVNVLCAAAIALFGMIAGLSLEDIGLSPSSAFSSIIPSVGIALIIAAGIYTASFIPRLRKYFKAEPVGKESRKYIAHTIALRIPLSTALLEEVLFRGVLLGLLINTHGEVKALAIASLLFGLWHIFPTVSQLEKNGELANNLSTKRHRDGAIAGVVLATSLAGAFFGVLRLWTGSLLTPWLVHWIINASGVIASVHSNKNSQNQ